MHCICPPVLLLAANFLMHANFTGNRGCGCVVELQLFCNVTLSYVVYIQTLRKQDLFYLVLNRGLSHVCLHVSTCCCKMCEIQAPSISLGPDMVIPFMSRHLR